MRPKRNWRSRTSSRASGLVGTGSRKLPPANILAGWLALGGRSSQGPPKSGVQEPLPEGLGGPAGQGARQTLQTLAGYFCH